ncbi:MAG TPA: RNA-binding S4 domain-containing protein [Burkholderiaceae bacterium]|nr:RNA-binding S4 domain-containing protein [Burkholderiaceae bacterium]
MSTLEKMRLDKWVWAARFYKTRSLAIEAIRLGRVQVNGKNAKPARDIAPGDLITIRKRLPPMHVEVLALSAVRGPAPVAQTLYRETPDSIEARERAAELRRLAPEPAHTRREGRPTKRDRRQMQRFRDR